MEDKMHPYKKIIESLKLLSLSFDEQEKYFPEFVDISFEVLDTFDNAILQLPVLIELGCLDNKAIASLLRLQILGEPIEKPDKNYI